MAWSGFEQMHLVLKQAGVQESSGLVSGRMQPAWYQFLTFRLSNILPQTTQNLLYKTSPDPVGFWLTVSGFGQTDPVQKPACMQESSALLLANASELIQMWCESDLAYLLGLLYLVWFQEKQTNSACRSTKAAWRRVEEVVSPLTLPLVKLYAVVSHKIIVRICFFAPHALKHWLDCCAEQPL